MENEPSIVSMLLKQTLDFFKANLLISSVLLLGLVLLGFGLIQFMIAKPAEEIEFIPAEEVAGAETAEIYVDVAGEVQNPGVYKLPPAARTQDALMAAGGMTADSDREYVAKALNLASPLKDGMKLYIPKKGEAAPGGATINSGSGSGSVGAIISINSASQSELESLPGIGPVTAGKIIAGRPYGSVEELVSKKAVGNATFQKIKDLVSL